MSSHDLVLDAKLFIFDIDGTLHVDGEVIAGAAALLDQLRAQNVSLRFLTNTTTKNQQMLLQQLHQVGIAAQSHEILSAPEASRIYLREQAQVLQREIRIWPVVHEDVILDYQDFRFDTEYPDFVIIGDVGSQWNYELLNRIYRALDRGAKLIALHKNRFWQTQTGLNVDIGLFVAGLEYVSRQDAVIVGKPAVAFFQQVLSSAHCTETEAVLVGDDIDSDIGGAQRLGIFAVLVKTGKYREHYYQQSKVRPDLLIDSVAALSAYLHLPQS